MADPTYKEKRKASAAAPSRSRRVRTQTQAFTFCASHKVRSRTDREVANIFREEVDDEICCPPACPPTTPAEVSPSPAATLADATGTHIGLPRASLLGWRGRAAPVAEPVQDSAPRPTSTVTEVVTRRESKNKVAGKELRRHGEDAMRARMAGDLVSASESHAAMMAVRPKGTATAAASPRSIPSCGTFF